MSTPCNHQPNVSMRGFTLIELMITLSVMAILVAIAMPAFSDLLARGQIADNSNALSGASTMARTEAVRRNRPINLCRVSSASSETCEKDNAATSWQYWIVRDGKGVITRGDLKTGRVSTTVDRSPLKFSPAGILTGGGARVNICAAGFGYRNLRTLDILSSGKVAAETKDSPTCP